MKFNTWYWDKDRSRYVFIIDYDGVMGSYCGWTKYKNSTLQFTELFAHPDEWVYDVEEKEPDDLFSLKKQYMIRDVFIRLKNAI